MKMRPLPPITQSKKPVERPAEYSEFSRILNIHTLGVEPQILKFSATSDEREQLKERLDIVELHDFEVWCQVSHNFVKGRVSVEAMLHAQLTQSCVLTLQDVEETLREPIFLELVTKCGAVNSADRFFNDEPEEIELGLDGTIDMGEVFVQYLSLSMNPYPRVGQQSLD